MSLISSPVPSRKGSRIGSRITSRNDRSGGSVSARNTIAYGAALEGSVVKRKTSFYIETRNNEDGPVKVGGANFDIEIVRLNTTLKQYDLVDKGNGTYELSYVPDIPGDYSISVKIGGENIKGSPFKTTVYLDTSTSYVVKCYLQIDDYNENEHKDVKITFAGPDGVKHTADHSYLGGGRFAISYKPVEIGDHVIDAYVGDKQADGCPYTVSFQGDPYITRMDACRSVAYGPGLKDSVVGDNVYFIIEGRNTYDQPLKDVLQPGDWQKNSVPIKVTVTREKSKDDREEDAHLPAPVVNVQDNGDGTFSVDYVSGRPGRYRVDILLDNEEIGPYYINIKPDPREEKVVEKAPAPAPAAPEPEPVPIEKKEEPAAKVPEYQALCRGFGATSAVVDTEAEFFIELYDEYANPAILTDLSLVKLDLELVKCKDEGRVGQTVPIKLEVASDEAKRRGFEGTILRASYVTKDVGDYKLSVAIQGNQVDKFPRVIPSDHNAIAYGPGLEEEVIENGQPALIIVETFNARGEKNEKGGGNVVATTSEGASATVTDNGNGTYLVKFASKKSGVHSVDISYNGRPIKVSPFKLKVAEPSYSFALGGKGISGATVGVQTTFTVDMLDKSTGKKLPLDTSRLTVEIETERGVRVPAQLRTKQDGSMEVVYTPTEEGVIKVNVEYQNEKIQGAPFNVTVQPPPTPRKKPKTIDASQCKAFGPGLEKATVFDRTSFTVELRDSEGDLFNPDVNKEAEVELTVEISGPKGTVVTEVIPSFTTPGQYNVYYSPQFTGAYKVDLRINGTSFPNSPYSLLCGRQQVDPKSSTASGPGLQDSVGRTGTKARFYVEAKDAKGRQIKGGGDNVEVKIKLPGGQTASGSVLDNGNGIYTVEYDVPEYGTYEIDTTINGVSIAQSPNKVNVKPATYTVELLSGTGINANTEDNELVIGSDADVRFRVQQENVGEEVESEIPAGLVQVKVIGPDGKELPTELDEANNSWGEFIANYKPTTKGDHTIQVFVEGKQLLEKTVYCKNTLVDPSKIVVYGPGVEMCVVDVPTKFTLETRDKFNNRIASGGKDFCKVVITDLEGKQIPVNVEDNGDGTFTVEYCAKSKGKHVVTISYDNENVQGSPFTVDAVTAAYNVKFDPNYTEATTNIESEFFVDIEDSLGNEIPPHKIPTLVFRTPDGGSLFAEVEPADSPGSSGKSRRFKAKYTPTQIGNYILDVKMDDKSVGNPKIVKVVQKADPDQTKLHGIEDVVACKSRQFTIELRDNAGNRLTRGGDNVKVAITKGDNTEVEAILIDDNNGLYNVEFAQLASGKYNIDVKVNGKTVPGAPYNFEVSSLLYDFDVRGRGVIGGKIQSSVSFYVEVKQRDNNQRIKADKNHFVITVTSPTNEILIPKVTETTDNCLSVTYPAQIPGQYIINITYDKVVIPTFPRTVAFVAKGSSINAGSVIKGDAINVQLQKDDEVLLGEEFKTIRVGLGWSTSEEVDLDASCVMLRFTTKKDHAFFKDTRSLDGAVFHTGDNRKGGDGVKDDEQIIVDLRKINPKVNTLIFVVNVFDSDKTFASVQNAYVRLSNDQNGKELCRYTLNQCKANTALIMCKLFRYGSLWKLRAIGESAGGHTFDKTLPEILPYLDRAAPKRTFEIRIHEAKELRSNYTINPYFLIKYDTDKEISRTVKATPEPKWQQLVKVKGEAEFVEVSIFNKRSNQTLLKSKASDELIGRVVIPLPKESPRISVGPAWYPIVIDSESNITGKVSVTITQVL